MKSSRDAGAWLLAASGAAAGACLLNYFPAGYFHDDAIYWLLSRALHAGRYAPASDPGAEALVNYLPGLPLALSAVSWTGWFGAGRLLSLAAMAGSWLLAWPVLRRLFGPRAGLAALAWLVWQPLALRHAGTVMTEPLFLLAASAAFALHVCGRRDSAAVDAGLAALAGYACWIRPTGALLAAALAADAFFRGAWRRAFFVAAGAALFQGALSAWAAARGQGASAFMAQWSFALAGAPPGTFRDALLANAAYYAELLPLAAALPLGKYAAALGPFRLPLAAGVWVLLLLGAVRLFRGAGRALVLYFALNAGLMLVWLRPDPRYALPALLPMAAFFAAALSRRPFPGEDPAFARGGRFAFVLAVALGVAGAFRAAGQASRGESPKLPQAAFAALTAALPPDAVVAGNAASTVYLHTGLRGTDFERTYEPEAFAARLVERGVTHVLVDAVPAVSARPDPNDWTPQALRMLTHPGWYEKVPGFSADGKELYRVKIDAAAFRAAYEAFHAGVRALEQGDRPAAEARFAEALAREPGFAGAADRLSYAALLSGDRAGAAARIGAALRIWPSDPLIRYHALLLGLPIDRAKLAEDARRWAFWPLIRAGFSR